MKSGAGKAVTDRIAGALAWFVFEPVGALLPFRACGAVAWPLATLAWGLGFRRSVILKNLALAFPHLPTRERRRIGRRSLVNLFTVFLEMLTIRHLSDRRLARVLDVPDRQWLPRETRGGALLLSGHVGNWELLAVGAAALSGMSFTVVVKDQKHGEEIRRTRTSHGNQLISTGRGARESAGVLACGGVVAMLADQAASDRDHLIEMFGLPTYSFSAPARLALRFRVPVIVGFGLRVAPGRYRLDISRMPTDDLSDTPEDAKRLTQRYVALLEDAIRKHPEQWVWAHRKWKSSPGISYAEKGR